MATRNQVLSLFGASPEQILEQRRREQAAEVLKQRDPFARAGGAIGMGLARLFGGEPAEVTRQRELYSQLEGVNFESPEQMRAAAASLQNQFPDRALQLLGMAEQSEARQQQVATGVAQQSLAEAKTGEIEAKGNFVEVPVLIPQIKIDITGRPSTTYTTQKIPVLREEADYYQNKFKTEYENIYNKAPGDDVLAEKNDKGTFIGRRYINGESVDVYEKDGETISYIGDEIYLPVDPEETQSNAPQQRKQKRSPVVSTPATSVVTSPAASNVRQGGQMRRNR